MDKKKINQLVELYFKYNPNMNRGVAFRIKANDIISSYAITHKKTFEEIKDCIEKSPMCQSPIWIQFYDFFNNNKKKDEQKSNYKNTIGDSTDISDWL